MNNIPSHSSSSFGIGRTDEICSEQPTSKKPASFNSRSVAQIPSTNKSDLDPHRIVAGHMDSVKNITAEVAQLPIGAHHKKDMLQRLYANFATLSSIKQSLYDAEDPAVGVRKAAEEVDKAMYISNEAKKAAQRNINLFKQSGRSQVKQSTFRNRSSAERIDEES